MTQIVCSAVLFGISIPAMAQGNTALRESRAIEPIITEESLPEAAGECNLRTTAGFRAGVLESETVLPRIQLFCGFSRRWGGEIDVPLTRVDGRYGPGDVAATVKYKLREQTTGMPAFVLGFETTFPTHGRDVSNKDADESGVEAEPFIAVLKQVHGLTVQGNVGLGISHSGSEREYRAKYNGAVATPLRHTGFALIGEVNAAASPSGTALLFSPGLHYSLREDWYVAFALPISSSGGPTRVGAVFQFQMRVRKGRTSE